MKSVYVDIRESILDSKHVDQSEGEQIDFSDVEFQIDLLKTKEELIMNFINGTRLSALKNTDDILESFLLLHADMGSGKRKKNLCSKK